MNRKLQVFISSTYVDLRDERQAVVEAVLQAGHMPAGMELFAAGNDSQWQVIQRWIEASDVLLLLLGPRYGSIEPTSGRSYVHAEYLHAEALSIPTIAIVLSDDFIERKMATSPSWSREDDSASYLDLKAHARTKMGADADDLNGIKVEVLRSLHELNALPNLIGWVRRNEVPVDAIARSEIQRLQLENDALRLGMADRGSGLKIDPGVESALEVVTKFGYTDPKTKAFTPMSAWLLTVANRIAMRFPHYVSTLEHPLFARSAELATYGLMEEFETESPGLFNMPPTRIKGYRLTPLGSAVVTELKRRQIVT